MKRFHFSLQPLLAYRLNVESQRRSEVALRLCDLEAAQAALEQLDEFFDRQIGLQRANHRNETGRFPRQGILFDALQRRRSLAAHSLAQREADLGSARGELRAAGRARKILEILRDRQRETYAAEQRRIEQRDLEESNAGRARAVSLGEPKGRLNRAALSC